MKLCTCNNCGNLYEDPNPSNESLDYPDSMPFGPLELIEDDGDFYYGCRECQTDGYLSDNINEHAGGVAEWIFMIIGFASNVGISMFDRDWSDALKFYKPKP